MEAAVAAVTAEFSGGFARPNGSGNVDRRGRGGSRRGGSRQSEGELGTDNSRFGREGDRGGHGGRARAYKDRNNGRQSTSASTSENEAFVELPATAQRTGDLSKVHGSRYRSQLSESVASTSDSLQSASGLSPAQLGVPTTEDLAALSYRERLTVQLNTSSVECPICYNSISPKQSISSCRTCSAPYHLRCLKDWADRSIAGIKEKALLQQPGVQIRASWRCPSCQTQSGEHETPKEYRCFCGRTKDPKATVGNAHSCEQLCKRERPQGCSHS